MGQIKSTMEMVLARAERLCAETSDSGTADDTMQLGMKVGASMLQGNAVNLPEEIGKLPPAEIASFCQGILRTLFRHIQLPRDEGQPWEAALLGLQQLAQALSLAPESYNQLVGLLGEVRSILGRYTQHRKQLETQLEEGFAMQAAQLQQTLAQQTGMKMKISPRQHPKFMEEWQRVQSQLNDQYLNALDQYKDAITALFDLA